MASKAGSASKLTPKDKQRRAAKLRRRAMVKGLATAPAVGPRPGGRRPFATFAAMSDPDASELDDLAPDDDPDTIARRMAVGAGGARVARGRGVMRP